MGVAAGSGRRFNVSVGLFGTRNRLELVPGAHFNANVDEMLIPDTPNSSHGTWVSQCNSQLNNGVNCIQDFKLPPYYSRVVLYVLSPGAICAFDDEATIAW